jgi:hypothetical protein
MAALQNYNEIRKVRQDLQKKVLDNLEQSKNVTTTSVENLKEQKKKFQREMKTQMDHLLELVQFSQGAGSSTMTYLKQKFIQASTKIGPLLHEQIMKESIIALGCASQQTY